MKPVVTAGVVLGLLVVAWTFVMGFTGWYKDPALLSLFYIVILIEIGVLVWGLRKTAALGKRYGGQVVSGLAISAIAAVIIFFGSVLFTAVVFPNYFDELREIQASVLRARGLAEEQVTAQLDLAKNFQTPVVNALLGVVGTIVTGAIASLIISAFVRSKPAPITE